MSTGDVTSLISTEAVQYIASSLADEHREMERRQLNIFVHNLKESAATNGAVRKQDDIKEHTSIPENLCINYQSILLG